MYFNNKLITPTPRVGFIVNIHDMENILCKMDH